MRWALPALGDLEEGFVGLDNRARTIAWILSFIWLSPVLAVAESPNVARGFQPEKSFELGEIDHINGFNKNLIVTLGIGGAYVVSPQLSYSLALTWNAQIWSGDEGSTPEATAVSPNPTAQAGLGWQFGMGRLIQPGQFGNKQNGPIYVAPDGSRTPFPAIPSGGSAVSLDMKYLRLRNLGSCASGFWTGQCLYEIDIPSGLVHRFRQSDGQLVSITDRFGNAVTIAYSASGDLWTITDGFRSHTVELSSKPLDTGNNVMMVDRVELAAFGTGATSEYLFNYTPAPTLPRPADTDIATGSTVSTTLLGSISGPEGWSVSMPEYQLDSTGGDKLAGTLQKVVLPTGGALEWDYRVLAFPADSDSRPFKTGSAGVKTRRTVLSNGNVEGTWSYVLPDKTVPAEEPFALEPGMKCLGPTLPPTSTFRTSVGPLGDKTVSFFTIWPCGDLGSSGQDSGDYGLPFDKGQIDPASGSFLSEEIWDCTANPADPPHPTNCGSSPKRRVYVKYERDGSNPQEVGQAMNQRLSYQKVVYVDDDNRFRETTWSTYDGYGHYRQELLGGSFDAANSHTTYTNYTPIASLAPSPKWMLGVYDRIDQSEGSETARREFVFDLTQGYLKCVRTIRVKPTIPIPRGANDLLTRFTVSAAGFVTQERFYGGDRQAIGTDGVCEDGASAEYTIDHTYQYGALKTSKYATLSWKLVDLTIDANTGLPSSSKDSAGIPTSFLYDRLGRLTESRPLGSGNFGPESWTKIDYAFGSQQSGSYTFVSIDRCKSTSGANCSGNNLLSTEFVDFDDFGRVWTEGRRLPGGAFNGRRTLYDEAGNRSQVSTVKDTGSFIYTTFSGFDPFGRPTTITAPDNKVTILTRAGDRTVETKQKVALALDGTESNAWRKETYDRQGRLFRVEELSNPGDPVTYDTKTDYTYDEAGRLLKVCQNASGAACGQERLFTYDNRSFLTSEKHPEKGSTGNGTVSYACYDSRGNAGQKADGDSSRISAFTFDSAERLTHVRSRASGAACSSTTGTLWKQFVYDTASGAGAGKLHQAIRRNDLPTPWSNNYQITESYEYAAQMGRASKRTTSLSIGGTAAETWSFTADYHELGMIDALDYPTCTGTGCASGSATPFSLGYTFTDGLLTAIPGWTSGAVSRPIDYHPNLHVATLQHANGMTETIANDPDRIQRPRSITVTALGADLLPVTAWATGDYAFDASGNVKAIGLDHFAYDRVSRLVDSDLDTSAPGRTQGYTFDVYGNITSKTTDVAGGGGTITFPQDLVPDLTGQPINRLDTPSTYDAAGNQTRYIANAYGFDLLNTMFAHCTSGTLSSCSGELWGYVYTADDERALALKSDGAEENWTIRDFGNRILRRDEWAPGGGSQQGTGIGTSCSGSITIYCQSFESGNYLGWSQIESGFTGTITDNIWRGDELFASVSTNGAVRHYALDHLGTIRVITDDLGRVLAKHAYFPFGEEATATNQDDERMKFTGHERDLQATTDNPADDVDQSHARSRSPLTGRFLSTDPASLNMRNPQALNRYTYAIGNPLKYVDPDGKSPLLFAVLAIAVAQMATPDVANAPSSASNVETSDRGGDRALTVAGFLPTGRVTSAIGRVVGSLFSRGVREGSILASELASKAAARGAVGKLGLGQAQRAGVNSAIGRATSSSSITILKQGEDVVVQVSRAGFDGRQVMQSIVKADGSKSVTQFGIDAAGKITPDPKIGNVVELVVPKN